MIYLALLRGINVGGNNKVDMKQLKAVFEAEGCRKVRTYINSGNVIFEDQRLATELADIAEAKIEAAFGFSVKVLIIDLPILQTVADALPDGWTNDSHMKCDVMFLWQQHDKQEVMQLLTVKPGIDNVKYVKGAILWSVDREHQARSGLLKLIGSDLYKQMTIRNCNTVRKLCALAEA